MEYRLEILRFFIANWRSGVVAALVAVLLLGRRSALAKRLDPDARANAFARRFVARGLARRRRIALLYRGSAPRQRRALRAAGTRA